MGLADRAPRGWHYQPSGLITVCMPYGMDTMYPYLGRLWVHGTMARTHARTYTHKGVSVRTMPLVRRILAHWRRRQQHVVQGGGRAGGRAEKPAKTTPLRDCGTHLSGRRADEGDDYPPPGVVHGQAPDGVVWNLEGRMYDDVGFLRTAAGPPCRVSR